MNSLQQSRSPTHSLNLSMCTLEGLIGDFDMEYVVRGNDSKMNSYFNVLSGRDVQLAHLSTPFDEYRYRVLTQGDP